MARANYRRREFARDTENAAGNYNAEGKGEDGVFQDLNQMPMQTAQERYSHAAERGNEGTKD